MSKQRPQRKTSQPSAKAPAQTKKTNNPGAKTETKPTQDILKSLREPWIQKRSAMIALAVVSIALMAMVAWNIIKGSGDWGRGLLWGFLFGASVWLVYFAMTLFHSMFNSKKK